MKQKNQTKIANQTALISFLVGTVLFTAYKLTEYDPLIGIGLLYIGLAIVVNVYTLGSTLFESIIDKGNRISLLLSSLVLTFNIPVVLLYINLL